MPLTIQTKTFEMLFTTLKRLIEQKAIGKPSGAPQSSVTAKIRSDILKPSSRNSVTSENDILSTPKNVAGFTLPQILILLRIISGQQNL